MDQHLSNINTYIHTHIYILKFIKRKNNLYFTTKIIYTNITKPNLSSSSIL